MLTRKRLATLLVSALVAVIASAGPSQAAVECVRWHPTLGVCLVQAGGGNSSGGTQPVVNPAARTGSTTCSYSGQVIPCTSGMGTWWASKSCYVALADPQPPLDNALWEGRTDGAIYKCSPPVGLPGTAIGFFWAASNPVGGPSPRALADRAVETMNLRAGAIGIVPEPGPGKVGIIGMPSWLWIADPGESTTGPITRSASGGGITVTATATLDQVVWSMGDGATVTCAGPAAVGTPYQASYGAASSPTCGHTYTRQSDDQPGDAYTVTATSSWTVTWSGGGATGTIPLDFTRTTQIRIGEIQVLVTG